MAATPNHPRLPNLRLVAPPDSPDGDLIREYLAGDVGAFGELIRRHQHAAYSVARRFLKNPDDAFDVCQKAFLKAFEARPPLLKQLAEAEGAAFRAYVLRSVINLSLNHARLRKRWKSVSDDALESLPTLKLDGFAALAEAQQRAAVKQAVSALAPRQFEVFSLRVDGELTFHEIASTLGITEGNAKAHFHYAVKRLASEVEQKLRAGEPHDV